MGDDNVIKFRKRPEPKKPQKGGNGRSPHNGKSPHNGQKPPQKGRAMRVPPFVALFLAALAIGGVMYLLDMQRPAVSSAREAAH